MGECGKFNPKLPVFREDTPIVASSTPPLPTKYTPPKLLVIENKKVYNFDYFTVKERAYFFDLARHVPKSNLGFKSNLYVIVGSKEMRTAEIELKGVKVKAQIPKFIDKIYNIHNQVNQSALNQILTYIANEANNSVQCTNNASSTITIQTSSGTAYRVGALISTLINSSTQFTDVFIAVDNSTNSYTAVSEILNPSTQLGTTAYGNPIPCQIPNFANANLSFTKSQNQSATIIWALTQDVSGLNVPLSQTDIAYFFLNQGCSGTFPNGWGITVYNTSGSSQGCSQTGNFLVTLGGITYWVIWCIDNSSASYTVGSIQGVALTGYFSNPCSFPSANIKWSTPPNSPGSKVSYGPATWYNALTLVA